jgi:hypothetical protein
MSAMDAVELILGIEWAAFWIYWLAGPTHLETEPPGPNAGKRFDDDQLGAAVRLGAHQPVRPPQRHRHSARSDSRSARIRVWGLPWSRSRVRRNLPAPQAG